VAAWIELENGKSISRLQKVAAAYIEQNNSYLLPSIFLQHKARCSWLLGCQGLSMINLGAKAPPNCSKSKMQNVRYKY
jgi:hypothetical protein